MSHQVVDNLGSKQGRQPGLVGIAQPFNTLVNDHSVIFDGVDEYVSIPDHASLGITNNLTVSAWVKGPPQTTGCIVTHSASPSGEKGWILQADNVDNTKLRVLLSSNGIDYQKIYVGSKVVWDNTWHQVAFTFGSSTLKIYVDGIEDTTPTKTSDLAVVSLFNVTKTLKIGATNVTPVSFYTGYIDEVSIWDTLVLSSSDIAELYNSGKPTDLSIHSRSADLVSWWRMGDGDTYNIISDNVASNDGTMINMESGDIVNVVP